MYIYLFRNSLGKITYVGITKNINKRISQHILKDKTVDVNKIECYYNSDELYIRRLEKFLICELKPSLNKAVYSSAKTLIPLDEEWIIYGGEYGKQLNL